MVGGNTIAAVPTTLRLKLTKPCKLISVYEYSYIYQPTGWDKTSKSK